MNAFYTMHLNKVLPLFCLPLGFSMLLILIGLVLDPKRRGRWLSIAGISILTICSIPFVSDRLIYQLEKRYPAMSISKCPHADAIVILGGILSEIQRDPELLDWHEAVERFEHAVTLYKAGKAPAILLTTGMENDAQTEGAHLKRAAIGHGVPANAILQTAKSDNTAGEAVNVAALAARNEIRSIILVTSANHMPRAMLLFERTGLKVTAFPVDYQTGFDHTYNAEDFLPDAEGLAKSQRAFRELYGLLFYTVLKR